MATGARSGWNTAWRTAGAACLLALASACAGDDRPPPKAPAPPAPMVTPTLPPPSPEFNAHNARPLPVPDAPSLRPPRPPEAPGPVAALVPLAVPAPLALPAADVPVPGAPAAMKKPIARPTGAPTPLPAEATEPMGPAAEPAAPAVPAPEGADAGVGSGFRLLFAPGSTELPAAAAALLRELADTMGREPAMRLKVLAYASGEAENPVPARRLSLQRALKVREALAGEGIASLRVDVLALGLTATAPPFDRVDLQPVR
jgi:outer membrane protein OmpA-like peptidoglycan-associated protein